MTIVEKAKECKKHFAVGEFKQASLLLQEIREADTANTYVQKGDGTIHVVEKNEDGTPKLIPRTEEYATKAVE